MCNYTYSLGRHFFCGNICTHTCIQTQGLQKLIVTALLQIVVEKAEAQKRHEFAEEVYMVHEMLARLQVSLEASHEANSQAAAQHRQAQDQLDGVKNQYQDAASHTNKQRMQGEKKIYERVLFCIFMYENFVNIFS